MGKVKWSSVKGVVVLGGDKSGNLVIECNEDVQLPPLEEVLYDEQGTLSVEERERRVPFLIKKLAEYFASDENLERDRDLYAGRAPKDKRPSRIYLV